MPLDWDFLARLFKMSPGAFDLGQVNVVPRLPAGRGVLVYYHEEFQSLHVPPEKLVVYQERVVKEQPLTYEELLVLVEQVEGRFLEHIGPIFISVLVPDVFTPTFFPSTVKLTGADLDALVELKKSVPSIEWDHASLLLDDLSTAVGVYEGKALAAIGHYIDVGNGIASVGVLTAPEHRGRGLAKTLASAAAQAALSDGWQVLYRALRSNPASVQVAYALGFTPQGEYSILI